MFLSVEKDFKAVTCGCGAYGKTPVFGLLQRGGKVYAKCFPIMPRSRPYRFSFAAQIDPESIIDSVYQRCYNSFVDLESK